MFGLERWRNSLGTPGYGVHRHIFGIAYMDVLMTIVFAVGLAWLAGWPVVYTIAGLFLAGIVAHALFGVRTTVARAIENAIP